jgi:hypothetical protein
MPNLRLKLAWLLCIATATFFLATPRNARANMLIVTNTDDNGSGSLRQAIADAVSGDTITFAVTGIITLTSGQLVIPEYKTLTIIGPDAPGLTISGNNASYILFIDYYATLTLSRVTLTNGDNYCCGGAIRNCAVLHLDQVTITHNSVHYNNCLGCGGAGIYNEYGATLFITNSTISGNQALGANNTGGGINNWSVLYLNNVTIANNFAPIGGGVYTKDSATTESQNTLIANNSYSGSGRDCSGTFSSQGYNLIGDTTGCTITGTLTGNVTDVDARIGPLGDYGGATWTHALFTGSPAIEAGNAAACATVDQRGVSRLLGGNCDIGAFEGTWYPHYLPLMFK